MSFASSRPLLAGLCLVLLAGCTRYAWVKPGASPQEFSADQFACMQISLQSAPPLPATNHTEYTSAGGRNCDPHKHDCGFHAQSSVETVDVNQGTRDRLTDTCLRARGWTLQPIEDKSKAD